MSFAAFKRLRRRLGWKHEYYRGKTHITPSHLTVTFLLDLVLGEANRLDGIRPLRGEDAESLRTPFLAAFAQAPEYADYSTDDFQNTANRYIHGFFGSVRGERSPASVVAERDGQIVGAALVKKQRSHLLLDCLFVRPDYARQGFATAMVSQVVNELAKFGASELLSYVLLANEPSLTWHYDFGFREIPDLGIASARCRFYHDEVDRLRQRADSHRRDLEELQIQATHWESEVKRLKELERQDFWAAHPHFED
jgi:GNAT superfamily N-acetyltransferase